MSAASHSIKSYWVISTQGLPPLLERRYRWRPDNCLEEGRTSGLGAWTTVWRRVEPVGSVLLALCSSLHEDYLSTLFRCEIFLKSLPLYFEHVFEYIYLVRELSLLTLYFNCLWWCNYCGSIESQIYMMSIPLGSSSAEPVLPLSFCLPSLSMSVVSWFRN